MPNKYILFYCPDMNAYQIMKLEQEEELAYVAIDEMFYEDAEDAAKELNQLERILEGLVSDQGGVR